MVTDAPVTTVIPEMVLNVKKLTNVRLELMNVTKTRIVATLPASTSANAVMDFMEMAKNVLKWTRKLTNEFWKEENDDLEMVFLINYLNKR